MRVKTEERGSKEGEVQYGGAVFSRLEDLMEHLGSVRRMRNDRGIGIEQLKVGYTQEVKRQMEIEERMREGVEEWVGEEEFRYRRDGPSSGVVREKYRGKERRKEYEKRMCNFD